MNWVYLLTQSLKVIFQYSSFSINHFSIHDDSSSSSSSSSSDSCSSSSTSSSPESTLTSYGSRRSDGSTRIKKTVTRSTLSLSVGGFVRRSSVMTEFKSGSCDSSAVILFPGISRTRERKDRGKTKHRKKGFIVLLITLRDEWISFKIWNDISGKSLIWFHWLLYWPVSGVPSLLASL